MAAETETPELTQHGFLFGNKLELTVEWIIGDALRDGSKEAFERAAEQLHGIDRFMLQLGLHIAALRVSNTTRKIRELAENDEMRAAWVAELAALKR